MITFLICFAVLVLAYFTYGRFVEKIMQPDADKKTPALSMTDGVDYVPMPQWKMFMIQFLNIAGLGPIFGAIMGAKFGTSAYIWIVIGCIFAGATHDYIAGMLSLRHSGESLPDLIGRYLGKNTMNVVRVFSILLMILVGVVFMSGPAGLLENLTTIRSYWWIAIIFVYYLLASMLPIDKLIGKVYPLFAVALIFMAVGVMAQLLINWPSIPELWDGVQNTHPNAENVPIFPMLFISIACGAISGFHATQSPMMARCMTNEKQARSIFYGAMIAESIIALIWAAIGMAFWGGVKGLNAAIAEYGGSAAKMVDVITETTLGPVVAACVLVGVVGCAVTSGDTAFRCARLIVSDMFNISQKSLLKRVLVSLPLFAVALFIIFALPFQTIWSYFAWCNQTLAVLTLWCITVYLFRIKKPILMGAVPALIMTYVCSSYIFVSPMMCGMENRALAYVLGGVLTLIIAAAVHFKARKG